MLTDHKEKYIKPLEKIFGEELERGWDSDGFFINLPKGRNCVTFKKGLWAIETFGDVSLFSTRDFRQILIVCSFIKESK